MAVHVLKPPTPLPADLAETPSVFLAGSIEMGRAEPWQDAIAEALNDALTSTPGDVLLLNPRRDAWDPSWPQDPAHEGFFGQVTWELEAQEQASILAFYFAPGTQSPISLLELGLAVERDIPTVVCCPPGFWRRGNVQIVCARYGLIMVEDLDALASTLAAMLS